MGCVWRFDGERVAPQALHIPAIQGIGHSLIYFVDRWRDKAGRGELVFDTDFLPQADTQDVQMSVSGVGRQAVDHFTQGVSRGTLRDWKDFYRNVLLFLFTGKARQRTGFDGFRRSRVARRPDPDSGVRRRPATHGNHDRYFHDHAADGVQHVALSTDDIFSALARIRGQGLEFVAPPDAYYEQRDVRLPGHGLDVNALRRHCVLVDGETAGTISPRLLLQAFLRCAPGEMALEIIERHGDSGFGEGNFAALEQVYRGRFPADVSR